MTIESADIQSDEPNLAQCLAQPGSLSIVIPLFNEQENLPPLYRKLTQTLGQLDRPYELILIDDGSIDATHQAIRDLAETDHHIVGVSFARNFGQTAAMSAGIELARGEIIVPMDGDLQNDPADIARLLEPLEQGFDVVSGWRRERKDHWSRVLPSRIANAVISRVSGVHLHDYGCSLKAYRRSVIQGVPLYGEMHRFIPIYATWRGARVTEIPVTHHPRAHGKSNYGFSRTIKVLLDLIVIKFLTSYLSKPIYFFGGVGIGFLLLSMVGFLLAMAFKIMPADNPWHPALHKDFSATPLPEWSVGAFVVGVQLVLIGLLAEMLMRTYYESQGRRPFIVRSIVGRERPDNLPTLDHPQPRPPARV